MGLHCSMFGRSDRPHAEMSGQNNYVFSVMFRNNVIYSTRNELASLAHSFYTCLKHQLMHQLYSSALPWIMLHA